MTSPCPDGRNPKDSSTLQLPVSPRWPSGSPDAIIPVVPRGPEGSSWLQVFVKGRVPSGVANAFWAVSREGREKDAEGWKGSPDKVYAPNGHYWLAQTRRTKLRQNPESMVWMEFAFWNHGCYILSTYFC